MGMWTCRRRLAAAVFVVLCVAPVTAPVVAQSIDTFEQLTVDATAGGVGFTVTTMDPTGKAQAQLATCRLETAEVRYTFDGTTVTSSVGILLEPGETLVVPGHDRMIRFRSIRTTANSGQLDCVYSR